MKATREKRKKSDQITLVISCEAAPFLSNFIGVRGDYYESITVCLLL